MKAGKKLFKIILIQSASHVPKTIYVESTSKEHALNAYYHNTLDNLDLYSSILVIDLENQIMKDPYDNNSIKAEIQSDFNSSDLDKVLSYDLNTPFLSDWAKNNEIYFRACTIIQNKKFEINDKELILELKKLDLDVDSFIEQVYQALDWAHQAIGKELYTS